MKATKERINEKRSVLAESPFFERLRATTEPDLARALWFGPPATFWVLAFQDVIRVNARLAHDPSVKAALEQHAREDSGHEEWFLDDLREAFGEEPRDVRWLFAHKHAAVREVAFRLMSEVFTVSDDRLRLVLVEVLEAGAGAYFDAISAFLRKSGHAGRLKYFGGLHLAAEAGHEMHAEGRAEETTLGALPSEVRREADAITDRMFAAFHALGAALLLFAPEERSR